MSKLKSKTLETIGQYGLRRLKVADEVVKEIAADVRSPLIARIEGALLVRGVPPKKIRSAIAQACDITPQSVAKWFDGRTNYPRADHLARMASLYNIDLHWLIMGDEPAVGYVPNDASI